MIVRDSFSRRGFLAASAAMAGLGLVGCGGGVPADESLPDCLARRGSAAESPSAQADLPPDFDTPSPNNLVVSDDDEPKVASVVPLGGQQQTLWVWSAASGKLLHRYRIDAGANLNWQQGRPVVLWPAGQDVGMLAVDSGVLGWLPTGHAVSRAPSDTGAVFLAVATPDRMASIGYDNTVRLHSLASCGEQRRFELDEPVYQLDLTGGGGVLVLQRSGLSRATADDRALSLVLPSQGMSAFAHSGSVVVLVGNRQAQVYNGWQPGAELAWDAAESLAGTSISADGGLFAGCLPGGHRLVIFQTSDGQRREIELPSESRCAAFGPDDEVYTIHLAEGVIAWDARTGAELRRFELPS